MNWIITTFFTRTNQFLPDLLFAKYSIGCVSLYSSSVVDLIDENSSAVSFKRTPISLLFYLCNLTNSLKAESDTFTKDYCVTLQRP